ncbi:hypothetical protein VFPPC_15759 [Pochonia chlamydosporia 170]|uniref:Uncharacterized protein n=1 Tax=Pochonia chlamydosporia 170 TaxID=1380566 RepID=A0A179FRU8_METCM|nr:hypothetical protein VFPPC_15759 [Pochonia chlamydosporia 170]OAQ67978.2 hypothetical protein VFPPC_15759 [Pochonia chlamydosporia 170]
MNHKRVSRVRQALHSISHRHFGRQSNNTSMSQSLRHWWKPNTCSSQHCHGSSNL